MKKILQSYLRRLTNLSANNRSILLLRLISDQFIDLNDFNFVDNKPSFSIVADLIGRKNQIRLCQQMDSRDDETNRISLALKRLKRVDHYIFEERGSCDLYVGWPFIRGKLADGTLVRCPLIFFPVTLDLEGKEWMLKPREEVNITFNKSFLLAYSYFNQIKLDDELVEQTFEEFDVDPTVFRTRLYQLIKDSPVEINFNQENFLNELVGFENFKKADFDKAQNHGELKLYPEAVIGIFPQAGSYLVPDYLHLLETDQYQDIEEFFFNRSRQEDVDEGKQHTEYFYFVNKVKEEETFTPFKLDAYQENALKAIKRGNSMVIQGPPGTGKSQLICNLISDFIARGRKVLLVCQKRAALDVVYQRLRENDIADFVALVHDFKNDRKTIYHQMQQQIDKLYEYKQKNNSLDAIQLERNFLQSSRKIDQITEELEEFKLALFDENEAGISVKELYLTSNREKPAINLKQEYKYFTFDKVTEFEDKLKYYYAYYKRFDLGNHPWSNRRNFSKYGISDLKNMTSILSEIPAYKSEIAERVKNLLGSEMDVQAGAKILEGEEKIREMLDFLDNETSYRYFRHIIASKDVISDSFPDNLWLSTLERTLLGCFDEPGPEMSLNSEELGKFQGVLKRRMDAQTNIYKFFKWWIFSKEKHLIKRILQNNQLTPKRRNFRLLEKMIDYRLNLEHNLTKIKGIKWLTDLPENPEREHFEKWFENQKKAVSAYVIFDSFRNFREYFSSDQLSLDEFKLKTNKLLEILSGVPQKMKRWQEYFRDGRIEALLNDPALSVTMIETLNDDFDALCDYDRIKDELEEYEKRLIEKLLDAEMASDEDSIINAFQNSLRLAWIDHIETKYPILRAVNSLKFERMQNDLQEAVKLKLKVSNDITLLKVREQTYQDVEFNRLNNMVTYRDLSHQVTKKRQIWPIRKLIGNFTNEIFDLVPCWMASPESVSAIFPMEQMFDLVIFDEASQCFSERGIPAMYRGKQIVVTGDDKQLAPFDLYKVRWDEDNEDEGALLEVDSLLDLANMYLMKAQLRGHYRSKSIDLIDFSNQHFYGGNLKLLPDKQIVNSGIPAIDYVKVDGLWEKNINTTEAQKVAEITLKQLSESPEKEIGIVTFNARQQDHIMDILEMKAMDRKMNIPDTLFVKNIENVQGDEKDIIIFSIGYAPDAKGKMIHQFGSLNVVNGENRLNVAVTRAREKVVIVSSIWPQQLKVEDARNEGPKLLKKYLEYAPQCVGRKFCTDIERLKQTPHRLVFEAKDPAFGARPKARFRGAGRNAICRSHLKEERQIHRADINRRRSLLPGDIH